MQINGTLILPYFIEMLPRTVSKTHCHNQREYSIKFTISAMDGSGVKYFTCTMENTCTVCPSLLQLYATLKQQSEHLEENFYSIELVIERVRQIRVTN